MLGISVGITISSLFAEVVYLLRFKSLLPLSIVTISLFITSVGLYFTPTLISVNYYIRHITKLFVQNRSPNDYIFQLATIPRKCKGIRGFFEDADDVGILQLQDNGLSFTGDHTKVLLPYYKIKEIKRYNVGWRALWLGGKRIKIKLGDDCNYCGLEFSERQSSTIISSIKISDYVFGHLRTKIKV